jgi:hypothetical protein
MNPPLQIDSDTPQRHEDPFGRLAFAQQLADYLVLQPGQDSLVLGLEGEWGSGKSWVIERVKQRLAQQNVITITFNPWLIGSENELIGAFMEEFASQLTEHGTLLQRAPGQLKRLAQAVASYGDKLLYLKYLKYLPGVAGVGEFIEDHAKQITAGTEGLKEALADKPSLSSARKTLEQALASLQQPMVVVIDDLDRLRKNEIQTMIQLVKAVGNFKGVAYLLSYDSKYVAQAISHDGSLAAGYAYLEKIVQLACHLPPLVPWIYRDWLANSTRAFLAQQGVSLTPFEEKHFDIDIKLVGTILRHLRDAVRWQNRLRWVFRSCFGAVYFGDLMIIEAIQIVSPESIRAIVAQPALVFPRFDRNLPREVRVRPAEPDQWIKHVAPDFAIQRALLVLFPHLSHPEMGFEVDDSARTNRRIQVMDNWLRYLTLSNISGHGDSAHISGLLQNSAQFGLLPNRFCGMEEFADFCHALLPQLQANNLPEPAYFIRHFCRTAKAMWSLHVTHENSLITLACLLRLLELTENDDVDAILHDIQEQAPLSLSGNLLARRKQLAKQPSKQQTSVEPALEGQVSDWINQIFADGKMDFLEHDRGWDILHSIRELASLESVRQLTARAFDRKKLRWLFDCYIDRDVDANDLFIFDYLPRDALLFPDLDSFTQGGTSFILFISTFSSPEMIAQIATRHPLIADYLRGQLAAAPEQTEQTDQADQADFQPDDEAP